MTFLLCLILILDIFVRYDMVAGLRVDHFYRICFPSLHSSLALFRITISSALLFTSFFKSCQKHNHQIIRVLTVHWLYSLLASVFFHLRRNKLNQFSFKLSLMIIAFVPHKTVFNSSRQIHFSYLITVEEKFINLLLSIINIYTVFENHKKSRI